MAKQVLIFWGIKVANFFQEVLNFLGSYMRVFTVYHVDRSGTEEEYSELSQLLEDILLYRRDMADLKAREKEERKKKERGDKQQGLEMRQAAMQGMSSKFLRFRSMFCPSKVTPPPNKSTFFGVPTQNKEICISPPIPSLFKNCQ